MFNLTTTTTNNNPQFPYYNPLNMLASACTPPSTHRTLPEDQCSKVITSIGRTISSKATPEKKLEAVIRIFADYHFDCLVSIEDLKKSPEIILKSISLKISSTKDLEPIPRLLAIYQRFQKFIPNPDAATNIDLSHIKNPKILLNTLIKNHRKELSAALQKALKNQGYSSDALKGELEPELEQELKDRDIVKLTNFTICLVPKMGYGLCATKYIREEAIIGGFLNGLLIETDEPKAEEGGARDLEEEEPDSSDYLVEVYVNIDGQNQRVLLDGNLPEVKKPFANLYSLNDGCQDGFGEQASILHLINYGLNNMANVAIRNIPVKCCGVTLSVPIIYARRPIIPGEELRMDYGDDYFNLNPSKFFKTFRNNSAEKPILVSELWKLYVLADEYYSTDTHKVKQVSKAAHDNIIRNLEGESKTLMENWKEEFFNTIQNLFNIQLEYATRSYETALLPRPLQSLPFRETIFDIILSLTNEEDPCNLVYKRLNDHAHPVLPAQEIYSLEILHSSDPERLYSVLIFFLFSDLEKQTKNRILFGIAYFFCDIIRTSSKSLLKVPFNPVLFETDRGITLLHLVAWLADDPSFANSIISLYERYSPDTFIGIAEGNSPLCFAEISGNALTTLMIKEAEARIDANRKE